MRHEWRVSLDWLERCRALAEGEVDRLHRTVRYRLGRACLDLLSRPWTAYRALAVALAAVRRGGTGPTPPMAPPQPRPHKAPSTPETDRRRAVLRAEVDRLWRSVWAIQADAAYRVGDAIVSSLRAPGPLRRLIGGLRVVARQPRIEPPPPLPRPSRGLRAGVTSPAASSPSWCCVAPDGIAEMLAFEGVQRYAGASSRQAGLLVVLDDRPVEALGAERLDGALASGGPGRRRVAWIIGSRSDHLPTRLLERFDQVVAAHPALVEPLSARLSGPVDHLPPAIQPRLHNPIGWWAGRADLGVAGAAEAMLPEAWRTLVDVARGRMPSRSRMAELATALNETLPEPQPPTWARPETARDWVRKARVRHLMANATLSRRLERLGDRAQPSPGSRQPPLATIYGSTCRPHCIDNLFANVARQSYPRCELIISLHGDGFDRPRIDALADELPHPVRAVEVPPTLTLGHAHHRAHSEGSGDVWLSMDDDDWYGRHYVQDIVDAFAYSEAMVVGKPTFVVRIVAEDRFYLCRPGLEYQYRVLNPGGGTTAFRRGVLDQVSMRPLPSGTDAWFVRDCLAAGFPLLATDRFGFVYHRRSPRAHTAQQSHATLLAFNDAVPFPPGVRVEDLE